MASNWMIKRDDAEHMVDVLEAHGHGHSLGLARELREMWKMGPQVLPDQPVAVAWDARSTWMLHNGGLWCQEWTKEWNYQKHGPMIPWLVKRIDAERTADQQAATRTTFGDRFEDYPAAPDKSAGVQWCPHGFIVGTCMTCRAALNDR